ncbi:hypothetical protein [Streptomyces sp. NPDC056194]|uniref:hypothetical protein n=1 Tax=unclassified Streptomyces TaxID=2593676 RepID=UPI0035E212FA
MSRTRRSPLRTPSRRLPFAAAVLTAAALDDGSVIGWGANAAAQLGDGTTTTPTGTTVALPPGSGITQVASTMTGKSAFAY